MNNMGSTTLLHPVFNNLEQMIIFGCGSSLPWTVPISLKVHVSRIVVGSVVFSEGSLCDPPGFFPPQKTNSFALASYNVDIITVRGGLVRFAKDAFDL